jgi:type VII secretion protein EccB
VPRAPATRDQADAYRFGLRRLEAALVRGDPVPLHEQIRTQRRAAFAGVLLGLLGLCAAAAYAVIVPRPDWRHEDVVAGSPSGAMYVVAHEPDRLVPVADLPAARLVLAAFGTGKAADASPTTVPDEEIATAPRTPTAAVPGAVAVTPEATVAARWAVCDTVGGDGALQSTTVIGGAVPATAGGGDGVLLAGPDDAEWLVTGGQRHRVDAGDGALKVAFRLTSRLPRAVDPALLSLIPEGAPLATPVIAGRGGPAPSGLPGAVGDVLVRDGGDTPQYFAVLADGLQEVPRPAADLLAPVSSARVARPVGADVIGNAPTVDDLRFDGWPDGPVRLAEPADAPVTCWTWSPERAGGDVVTAAALPVPPGTAPVTLASSDGPGARVDAVAVGAGGAVRATGQGRAPGAGPVWLVSASGVAYGVADADTAAALGVGPTEPAPEAALKMLPTGPPLALDGARQAVDVLPGG